MKTHFHDRSTPERIIANTVGFFLLGMLAVATICLADDQIIQNDGSVNKRIFDLEWRKYSDIDERIPLQSRSWEAQQYQASLEEITAAKLEITRLMALMELDRQARLAMRDYQQALTRGLHANLVKSFIRLTWITYNTIGGPTGKQGMIETGTNLGEFIAEPFGKMFLTEASKIALFARTASIVKKVVPKQYSKLPGGEGKVVNVGVDAMLATLRNIDQGSPDKFAINVTAGIMKTGEELYTTTDATDPNFSPAELEILRKQRENLELFKGMVAASYKLNEERQARIEALESQIADAQKRAAEWEKQEKERILAKIQLESKKPQLVKVTLSAPKQVAIGETAIVSGQASGGSGQYTFQWFTPKQGDQGSARPASNPQGSSIAFRAYTPGAHTILLNVTDGNDYTSGHVSIVIEVVSPSVKNAPPQVVKPAPPVRAPGSPLETLTVIKDGDEGGHMTSFSTMPGRKYTIEASGLVTVKYYSEKGTYLGTNVYDAVYTARKFDYKWDAPSGNPNRDFDQQAAPETQNAKTTTLLINKPCCAMPATTVESFRPYVGTGNVPQYNKQHVYKFEYPGDGKPIRFYFWYSETSTSRKSGGFLVKIFENPDIAQSKR